MSSSEDPAVRAGRPRSERARLAVLEAAGDLLIESGLAAATIESIAARVGVSKMTIYKWWPTRGSVAIDAYFHRYRQTIELDERGDIESDLARQMASLVATFAGRAGEVMAELVGQAQRDPVLAEQLRERWIAPRREVTAALLGRAIERGEIARDVDLSVLLDQLFAPIYFRLLMRHAPLSEELASTLVSCALDGVRSRNEPEPTEKS